MKQKLLKQMFLAAVLFGVGVSDAWATDVPYNVGSSTSDAWGTAFSDMWTLTGDGAVTVTFTNHCATDGNWWDNWQLLCGNESFTTSARDDANRYFQMRSDRWDDAANSSVGFIVSDDYFTDFKTFQNEATVTMSIVRSGTTVTVNTSVTKSATTRTITFVKTGLEGTINLFLTQSLSYMTITAQDQTTEMAGTVTCNALMNYSNFSGDDGGDTPSNIAGGKGTMYFSGAKLVKIADGDYRVGLRSGSSNISIASSEYAGSKDIVTVSFDLNYCQMGSNKKVYFYLQDASNADIATLDVGTQNASPYFRTFNSNTLGVTSDDIVVSYNSTNWDNKVHYTITLNYLTGKITTTTACAGATNTTSSHTVDMTNTNPLAKFVIGADYNQNSATYRSQFDNLLIQTEKGDYNTTANITLAFEDNNGDDISALYTGTTAFTPDKSTTFTPSDYYPTVMYDDDYKYTYTSGGDAFTVTGDVTVTLVYTKTARPTYTFNVTANYGAKNQKIVDEVTVKEAADYTYYYPRFIKDGTTLYEYASSTDANASGSYWTSTATNVAADGTYTLTYNAIEGECVYYSEGEDLASKTGTYTYANWRQYMSNGSSGVFESGALTTLEEGMYTITARAIGRSTDRYIDIYKDSKSDENKLLRVVSSNNGQEATSSAFTLTGNTDIIIDGGATNASNNGHGCDYVYIIKLPSTVSKSITSAGWATYCSPYALDFSSAIANLDAAYIVTGGADGVLTTEAVTTTVAANTGLLLKGSAGTVTIPVAASGTDYSATNKLVGVTVATEKAQNTAYVLMNDATNGLGFYLNGNATAFTVGANTAYLPANFDATPVRGFFLLDGETTGVGAALMNKAAMNKEVYNLNGQRVAAPQKGLYIVSGKKVIIK